MFRQCARARRRLRYEDGVTSRAYADVAGATFHDRERTKEPPSLHPGKYLVHGGEVPWSTMAEPHDAELRHADPADVMEQVRVEPLELLSTGFDPIQTAAHFALLHRDEPPALDLNYPALRTGRQRTGERGRLSKGKRIDDDGPPINPE